MSRRLRVATAVAAAAAMASLVGCGMLPARESPLLPGSQWIVSAVDGQPVAGGEVILTMLADSATVSSTCGASIGEVIENQGADLTFGQFQGPAGEPTCPAGALEAHRRVADALGGVETWETVGESTELRGEHVIRLEPQRTDT